MTAEHMEDRQPTPRLSVVRKEAQERAARAATTVGKLPTQVNLTMYQGDSFYLRITLTGSNIDITGYTAKADIKSSPGSGSVIASFAATVSAPTQIDLALSAAQSVLVPSAASWDVQITDSAGVVTTLAYGSITSMRQVTT